jgi:hypothetical protein
MLDHANLSAIHVIFRLTPNNSTLKPRLQHADYYYSDSQFSDCFLLAFHLVLLTDQTFLLAEPLMISLLLSIIELRIFSLMGSLLIIHQVTHAPLLP